MGNDAVLGVLGTTISAPRKGEVEINRDDLLIIDKNGVISEKLASSHPEYEAAKRALQDCQSLLQLKITQYLLPGMIDLHIHAPQWPQMGKAYHLPLENWLQEHTFPLESSYRNVQFAAEVYSSLVDHLIRFGTTTAVYFGSIHLAATRVLAEICLQKGQRAIVGAVAMDNPEECPDFYRDNSAQDGIRKTRSLIRQISLLPGNERALVRPAVTPRFLPSCSDEMLRGLGALAEEFSCHIQTHCAESDWTQQYGLKRFGKSDFETLRSFGLLNDRTILAHCAYMDESGAHLVRQAGAGIAHCPTSNIYFSNAVFPARLALDSGVHCGLGTDIAGGHSASVLHSCNAAITASRIRESGTNGYVAQSERGLPNTRIDYKEAFWMATAGGGEVLGEKVGKLQAGFEFDALVIDTDVPHSNLLVWPDMDSDSDILQKIIYNTTMQNITNVWVKGRPVL